MATPVAILRIVCLRFHSLDHYNKWAIGPYINITR